VTSFVFAAKPWPAFGARPLLGANGTEAMQALLPQGGAALVDYFKVGPFMGREALARLAPDYPLMLHLDDTLSGHTPLPETSVARINDLVQLTGTPWTSEHIGFSVADVDLDGALITQPASQALSREQAMENIVRNARALAVGLSVPLLLENIPLFPNWAHMYVAEPDFITEVLVATGCNLLLDLAHARVTADVLGYDVHDYLLRLPLEHTIELHLSGPRQVLESDARRQAIIMGNARSVAGVLAFDEHNLIDAHEPMQAVDYALLAWVLERTHPRAISLEYFRNAEALRTQLVRLGEMIGR
jgi:uncharacterized protein (UPF0276 family)